ncbi:GTPase [Stutzerimonas nitrititolerans]|uniref:GTPase n=1 Tax=Stutzerimonas nitrititolerans TaxID=2482751 RepID=UPI003F7EEEEE
MMQDSVLSHALATFDAIDGVCEKYNPSGLVPIRRMVAEKRSSPNASIMVYGVYNAGKSTLINALLGEADRAKVADKPETDKVSSYRWREFEILDTPGIDAPISHEQVTQEQLCLVDVVIFVVNPLGVVEEAKTLSTLLELIKRKKKIVLVLNCKNSLEPLAAERIKDQLRQRLQEMAHEKGLSQVLQEIPILEVNAKTALKAKLEGKVNLLANSGFPLLERELHKFLNSVNQNDIISSFITELTGFLDETLRLLAQKSDSASISQIDSFYAEIARREINIRANLKGLVEAKSAFIEKRAFGIISSTPDDAQNKIGDLVQISNAEIFSELEDELRRLAADASMLLNDLVEEIKVNGGAKALTTDFTTLSENVTPEMVSQGLANQGTGIDLQTLQAGVQQIGGLLKPEHVVSAMKLGKDLLPSLFKGIGPATMGKVGEQIVSKIVPAIGIAIQAGQILFSMFGNDPEEERIREEARQREQMEERRNQAIRDLSENIAWEFRTAIVKVVDENIRNNFAEVNGKLKEIRNSFSEAQRELSEDRASLVESQAALKAYA